MEEVRRIDEECKEVCNQETEVENDVTQFLPSDPWLSWGEERKNPVCNERGLSKIAGTTKEAKNFIQNPEKMYRFAVLMLTTTVEVVDLKKSLDTIVNEVKEEIQAYFVSERKPLQMNFVEAQESLDILIKAKGMGFLQLQSDTIANQSVLKAVELRRRLFGFALNLLWPQGIMEEIRASIKWVEQRWRPKIKMVKTSWQEYTFKILTMVHTKSVILSKKAGEL